MKKALFAEDADWALEEWIAGLKSDGFKLGDKEPSQIIEQAKSGIVVLTHKGNELHLTSHAPSAGQATHDHTYDVCFLDTSLIGGTTFDTMGRILKESSGPQIFAISDSVDMVARMLAEKHGLDIRKLVEEERFVASYKDYVYSRKALSQLFDFKIPERPKPKASAPKRKRAP